MPKKHTKHLKEADFEVIKTYLDQGLRIPKIVKLTSRSNGTISYIRRFDSYPEYRNYITKRNQVISKSRVNPVETADIEELVRQLDQQFESLKTTMIQVVELAVKVRTAEAIKAHQAELAAYKTVVEAAQKNNLVTSLKQALMGNN